MNAKQLFDYIGYFRGLWQQNKLAQQEQFKFCTCSGIETLQGPLQQFRTANAFFCVDDTNDGATCAHRRGLCVVHLDQLHTGACWIKAALSGHLFLTWKSHGLHLL